MNKRTEIKKNTITKREAFDRMSQDESGLIFKARFIKKDGTERAMVCRRGVRKNLTGKGMNHDPAKHLNLVVYDMQKQAYRMVSCSRLLELTVAGETFEVID